MADPILYIVGEYPSQSETFIEREVTGLRQLGLDIDVCPLASTSWPRALTSLVSRLAPAARLWRVLRSDSARSTARRTAGAVLRAAEIAARRPQVRHIHAQFLGLPATVAYCLSHMLAKPYSLTAHARDIYVEETPGIVVREARFRVTCTETNRAFLDARYPQAPWRLIRHGLDPALYATTRPRNSGSPCRLLAVGRLVDKKGFSFLIQACRRLVDEGFPFSCAIIGDGPNRANLQAEIDHSDLRGVLRILGMLPHDQVVRRYHDADVMVVPSVTAADGDRDGVPNVILEAMASGLPVISTDAGAISELVQHEVTGLMVPQGDPESIARAVQYLWNHPAVRGGLVDRGLACVKTDYRPAEWLEALHALFCASDPGHE